MNEQLCLFCEPETYCTFHEVPSGTLIYDRDVTKAVYNFFGDGCWWVQLRNNRELRLTQSEMRRLYDVGFLYV